MNSEAIPGWFLTFTKEEYKELEDGLTQEGYEFSIAGLKEFIFDCLADEGDPQEARREQHKAQDATIAAQVAAYLKEHPEVVSTYATLGKTALNSVVQKVMAQMTKARKPS